MYRRGDYGISVEKIDGFGKNPGLWIHHNNVATKVASFGSDEKAKRFTEYLNYLVLINGKEPDEACESG